MEGDFSPVRDRARALSFYVWWMVELVCFPRDSTGRVPPASISSKRRQPVPNVRRSAVDVFFGPVVGLGTRLGFVDLRGPRTEPSHDALVRAKDGNAQRR
jgi:hypothetical protein